MKLKRQNKRKCNYYTSSCDLCNKHGKIKCYSEVLGEVKRGDKLSCPAKHIHVCSKICLNILILKELND